jgi:hypothetical protein
MNAEQFIKPFQDDHPEMIFDGSDRKEIEGKTGKELSKGMSTWIKENADEDISTKEAKTIQNNPVFHKFLEEARNTYIKELLD